MDGESDLGLKTWDENMVWAARSGFCDEHLADCHGLEFGVKG